MLVWELIEDLSMLDPNLKVLVSGDEESGETVEPTLVILDTCVILSNQG